MKGGRLSMAAVRDRDLHPFAVAGGVPAGWRGVWPDPPVNAAVLVPFIKETLSRAAYCPGDFHRDGVVDSQDAYDFWTDLNATPPVDEADWDMDGQWDQFDWDFFVDSWYQACPCQ
jgi:hypothetical protein